MQEAREGGLDQIIADPLGERLDAGEQRGGERAFRVRLTRHEQQAVVAEERHPSIGLRIGLGQAADQRIASIAEPRAPGGMKLGDQLAGMTLNAWRDATAVVVDEVHHQEIGLGMVDQRDRELRQPRQLAQHERLELETRLAVSCALPRLHRQPASVGERERKPCDTEADGQRASLDHDRAERLFKPCFQRASDHHLAVNLFADVTSLQ